MTREAGASHARNFSSGFPASVSSLPAVTLSTTSLLLSRRPRPHEGCLCINRQRRVRLGWAAFFSRFSGKVMNTERDWVFFWRVCWLLVMLPNNYQVFASFL